MSPQLAAMLEAYRRQRDVGSKSHLSSSHCSSEIGVSLYGHGGVYGERPVAGGARIASMTRRRE